MVKGEYGSEPGPMFVHGYTYSGHAAICVAAMASLDILEREGLVDGLVATFDDLAAGR